MHRAPRLIPILCVQGLLLAASAFAAEIPARTHLLLRMQNSVSTRTAGRGDYVYLKTETPISVDGAVTVPVGSYVQGVVDDVVRPGKVKGKGQMSIRLEAITLPTGKVLKLDTPADETNETARLASTDPGTGQKVTGEDNRIEQTGSKGRDAAQIAILTGQGTWIGAMVGRTATGGSLRGAGIGAGAGAAVGLATVLMTRGREVELRQGDTLDIVFDRSVPID